MTDGPDLRQDDHSFELRGFDDSPEKERPQRAKQQSDKAKKAAAAPAPAPAEETATKEPKKQQGQSWPSTWPSI